MAHYGLYGGSARSVGRHQFYPQQDHGVSQQAERRNQRCEIRDTVHTADGGKRGTGDIGGGSVYRFDGGFKGDS